MKTFATILAALTLTAAAHASKDCNVRDFGAKGDGTTLDSPAINRAIAACDTVHIPAGTYRSGSILLKSNLTLILEANATILGSKDLHDYVSIEPPNHHSLALVGGANLHHVTIEGPGAFDGVSLTDPNGEEHIRGPLGIFLLRAEDITLRNLNVRNSGNWNVVFRHATRITIDGLIVHGGYDGINADDFTHSTITNSKFFVGDDALAGRYWEDVTVSHSELNSPTNGIRMAGHNVLIQDSLISGPAEVAAGASGRHVQEAAFQILANGDGHANLYAKPGPADNMTLSHVKIVNCYTPIYLAQGPGVPYNDHSAGMGKFTLSDVDVELAGNTPMYVAGTADQHVGELVLHNVHIHAAGGLTQQDAHENGTAVFSIMPFSTLYLRYLDKLTIDGLDVRFAQPDLRPAIFADHVGTLSLTASYIARPAGAEPLLEGIALDHLTLGGKPIDHAAADIAAIDLPTGPVYASRPTSFTVTAHAQIPGTDTRIVTIHGTAGSQVFDRDVVLDPRQQEQQAHILFPDNRFSEPPDLPFHFGSITRDLQVLPLGNSAPPPASLKVFTNTNGTVEAQPDGIHIRSKSDGMHLYRKDEYTAAYQPQSLPENATITVRLENPEIHTGWGGRAGIMVRRSIADPAKSSGYLILAASPAGTAMDWDAAGHGMIDQHTPYDGSTIWPLYLRLDRAGIHFTGYTSRDGKSWTKLAEADVPSASGPLDAGFFTFNSTALFTTFTITH